MSQTLRPPSHLVGNEFSLGVIMLKTSFPRLLGDIGNPDTFDYPVTYEIVDLATVDSVVSENALAQAVLSDIVTAARKLEKQGVDVISTSCGFLAQIQGAIQSEIKTPFIGSSLNIIPFLDTIYGKRNSIGILTFDEEKLLPIHFNSHYREGLHIQGIDKQSTLYNAIKKDLKELNFKTVEKEVVGAAMQLVKKHGDVSCIILECTNLSPYANAIRETINKPVFDLVQTLDWLSNAGFYRQ